MQVDGGFNGGFGPSVERGQWRFGGKRIEKTRENTLKNRRRRRRENTGMATGRVWSGFGQYQTRSAYTLARFEPNASFF